MIASLALGLILPRQNRCRALVHSAIGHKETRLGAVEGTRFFDDRLQLAQRLDSFACTAGGLDLGELLVKTQEGTRKWRLRAGRPLQEFLQSGKSPGQKEVLQRF